MTVDTYYFAVLLRAIHWRNWLRGTAPRRTRRTRSKIRVCRLYEYDMTFRHLLPCDNENESLRRRGLWGLAGLSGRSGERGSLLPHLGARGDQMVQIGLHRRKGAALPSALHACLIRVADMLRQMRGAQRLRRVVVAEAA